MNWKLSCLFTLIMAGSLLALDQESLKIKGDLRYRHEIIDDETKDEIRNRQRIKAGLGVEAKAHKDVKVGIYLATGASDPISNNETLTNSFAPKAFTLKEAYFLWNPADFQLLTIQGGKFKNPFRTPGKTELIWDGDLTFEGGFIGLSTGEKFELELNNGGFWLTENSEANDVMLLGSQLVSSLNLSEHTMIQLGASFFGYKHLGVLLVNNANGFGNSVNSAGLYAEDFNLAELFMSLNLNQKGLPISVFGDYVNNTSAHHDNIGWLVGLSLGKAKKAGSWALSYNYRVVEADAVIGALTDSDFAGGGTDVKGHELGAKYMISEGVDFCLGGFVNQKGEDESESNKYQFDFTFKF
jgi:hypothetical protein